MSVPHRRDRIAVRNLPIDAIFAAQGPDNLVLLYGPYVMAHIDLSTVGPSAEPKPP